MKKVILFIIIISSLIACEKRNQTFQDDIYSDYDDDTEIFDFDDDSDDTESTELEERGVVFKIFSVKPLSEEDTVSLINNCGKYNGYPKVDIYAGTQFKITGSGFGATKGTSELLITYRTVVNFPMVINSWSDTAIVVSIIKFEDVAKPVLKNLSMKFTLLKDFTSTTNVTTRKKTSKSIKVVSWYKNYGGENFSHLGADIDAYYPSSLWEVAWQQVQRNNNFFYSERIAIDSFYTPKIGDVLTRSPTVKQFAVIFTISNPDSKGFINIKVKERNYKCNGSLQTKTYKFKNGVFTPKYGEPVFTHYCYEASI